MNRRFRPDFFPRVLAAAAAVVVTAGVLAAVHGGAGAGRPQRSVVATGEVTATGPAYRLPTIVVRNRAELFLALPELIDGVLDAHATGASRDGTPGA